ncbi:sugar ABC transporter ATP-binding protein [Treponema brennaborense]|uniref:Ribose/galactose/methyl galactoside import ATP-binding protein n=1 Tax=Treponema brennaborense (strain DSM 12168 / CIP 105900 / DD5/3) TaxID=906968 RepID=F4LLA8_TREBD|nr:sugar ABC transporter ATP-binding protein [Treponema brennaborense]AEE15586.1 Monosaccharide-transporting ATPase [Treponema brennaborense DSM 12168]
MSEEYILRMEHITKQFPGVLALNDVSLNIRPGTVHALMGENGAGKSTLMKCLFGIYHPDSGSVILHDKEVKFHSAKDALDSGISMIHQELSNVPHRTVCQNIWLGREPMRRGTPLIDHGEMFGKTAELMERLGLGIDPLCKMGTLSISEQQSCEIVKAVSAGASVVVMDEPTSSLSEREVEHLFRIINDLRSQGVAIIYISHRMNEIFQIADEISVMRDGNMIGSWSAAELNEDKLINLMIGRVTTQRFPPVEARPGDVCLHVEHLCSAEPNSFQDITFDLHRSEILGIGGLVGAQRSELVESIFGLRQIKCGTVSVNGRHVAIKSPKDAIRNKIGLITEDRRGTGIFPLLSITVNTAVAAVDKYLSRFGFIRHKDVAAKTMELNKLLHTKTPSMNSKIQNLSGGNQQKVIVSRWLMTDPDILIMDEPTRGIDVGAKYEIYTIMADLVKQGKSIIMVSSEMPELLGMAHRVMVLCNGRLTGVLDKKDASQEAVMRLATQF